MLFRASEKIEPGERRGGLPSITTSAGSPRNSSTPSRTPFTFDRVPCAMRVSAVVTRAAAVSSKPSNHRVLGQVPGSRTFAELRRRDAIRRLERSAQVRVAGESAREDGDHLEHETFDRQRREVILGVELGDEPRS